jgi:uncharacterized cupredoxin-like copper-binding protein
MSHPRQALIGAALAGLLLALAACGGSSQPGRVQVTASEFTFELNPITVAAGREATLVFTNAGTTEHDFTVDELGIKVLAEVTETVEAELGRFEAGRYIVYCSIPGHREAGMEATLIVE